MSFLIAFGLVIGIAASGLSLYEFLQKRNVPGTIYGVVAAGLIVAAILLSIFPSLSPGGSGSGGNQPGNTPTVTISPQKGTTATTVPTTPATIAPTQIPTTTSKSPSEYSAAQPGPGCDKNEGTWTPQGISGVTCGTWVSTSPQYAWGYLFLQLPNNAAFAANNEISVTLSTNATSNRTNTTLLLSLVNNTLKFAIDTEAHQISIPSFQPTKVAITFYDNGCGNCTAETSNFNYITPAS